MGKRTEIAELYRSPESYAGREIAVSGWVRTVRDSKSVGFMELNDGSAFKGLQVILERDTGRSRGFGFVSYTDEESAKAACAQKPLRSPPST